MSPSTDMYGVIYYSKHIGDRKTGEACQNSSMPNPESEWFAMSGQHGEQFISWPGVDYFYAQ
jgi:hypothetical protein